MISELSSRQRRRVSEASQSEVEFQRLKTAIHEELIESLDLSLVGEVDEEQLGDEIRRLAEEICSDLGKRLDAQGHQRMLRELMDEIFGLGPLEALMQDPTISDILVNGPHEVFVERHGRLEQADVVFADEQHLMRIIQRIVARVGRRIDEVSPMVDARLARRIARQRHHPAAGPGRPEAVDPPLRRRPAQTPTTWWTTARCPAGDAAVPRRRRSRRGSAS